MLEGKPLFLLFLVFHRRMKLGIFLRKTVNTDAEQEYWGAFKMRKAELKIRLKNNIYSSHLNELLLNYTAAPGLFNFYDVMLGLQGHQLLGN